MVRQAALFQTIAADRRFPSGMARTRTPGWALPTEQ